MIMEKAAKIVIIGAGASGIAAASHLLQHGIEDITILEAENRIGGRIHSIDFHGSTVDLGAQWCHGQKNNIVYKLASKLDLLSSSINSYDDFTFYDSKGTVVDKTITDGFLGIGNTIREDETAQKAYKGSFGKYFIERYNKEISEQLDDNQNNLKISQNILTWLHNMYVCLDAAETWFDVSPTGEYISCEGDYYLNWRNSGYKTILEVLMKKIPKSERALPVEDKIFLNKEVCKISYPDKNQNELIFVKCSDGTFYKADHVITSVSLGVLKKKYKNLFSPQLPMSKQNAIVGLGFGTVNKILLKFTDWWWSKTSKGFSLLWSEDDANIISNLSQKMNYDMSWLERINGFYPVDGHPILLAFVVGPEALTFEFLPQHAVLEGCMSVLKMFLGAQYKIIPAVDVLYSSWNSNSHFCGSYSYRSNMSDQINVSTGDLANPILVNDKPLLLFAGEATHPIYYSTVHGAIESGFREADRILKYYDRRLQML